MRVGREVRAHREARGLSISAAAERAGVSKTSLATLESGVGNPSLDTLSRVAGALDVPVSTLFVGDEPVVTRLIRRAGADWASYESGLRGRVLHVDGRDRRWEVLELRLAKGRRYASPPHAPGTEELVVCVEGDVTVGPAGHEERLVPGDALNFAADVPHTYRSRAGGVALCCFSFPAVSLR
jgi:transcriptional regulator with XRE-family HTH domain